MNSNELRRKFLEFFEGKGHKVAPSSSLIPADASVLFTTAGMQQFKPYYLGEKSPFGFNVCSCQKCFRTSDIEEVGDESHLTFLEMLGNFSFGGYFKEEAIKLAHEFLFDELKLPLAKAVFTVFEGNSAVPEDKESIEIWKKLGIPETKIKKCGREDNFWGPTGEEGPCGPTTEIHFDGTEVWNLVFNEYFQDKTGKLTPLKQKGVDTGMGLERLAIAVQDKSSVYETDLFLPIVIQIPSENEKAKRIISDHVKSSVFLIADGILPSNLERGYVLRRVLRRAIRYGKMLNLQENFLIPLAQKAIEIYKNIYPELKSKETDIITAIQNEEEKFEKSLEEGLKQFEKGTDAFELYTSYGFPLELTLELAKEKGKNINLEEFNKKFKEHQELSRTASSGMFKGGLADASEQAVKYHTANHLLLAALRQVLGSHVSQKGSNITAERLRFDFVHPGKMTDKEIKEVEDIVNQKIKDDLTVICQEMTLAEAKEKGATGVFEDKYEEKVKVYSINDFSKEICGGPHVKRTGQLGSFKIIKEESSSAGIRRIRAVLE
ncbi:MAG: alanine--tRNA ligase [Candidatus Nealsonbacteria bacterium]|nr:alanine--tRNA ligase [Candidatus Nealsonbacteria bacterium]